MDVLDRGKWAIRDCREWPHNYFAKIARSQAQKRFIKKEDNLKVNPCRKRKPMELFCHESRYMRIEECGQSNEQPHFSSDKGPSIKYVSLRPLRSLDRHDLYVPRARTSMAQTRAFAIIGPSLWN